LARLRLLDLAGGVYPLKEAGMLRREERGVKLVRMTLLISSFPSKGKEGEDVQVVFSDLNRGDCLAAVAFVISSLILLLWEGASLR
jgi:hypothetical protein